MSYQSVSFATAKRLKEFDELTDRVVLDVAGSAEAKRRAATERRVTDTALPV